MVGWGGGGRERESTGRFMGLRYKNNIAPYNQENRRWERRGEGGREREGLDGLSVMNIALRCEEKKEMGERERGRERDR